MMEQSSLTTTCTKCTRTLFQSGYCSTHYYQILNTDIEIPECILLECKRDQKALGFCAGHHEHYKNVVEAGLATWQEIDTLVLQHNEQALLEKKRIELIKERHALSKLRKINTASELPDMAAQEPLFEVVDLIDEEQIDTEFEKYLERLEREE